MFAPPSIQLLQDSLRAGRPLQGPLDVQLLPTPRCNAACVFCPLHAIPAPLMKLTPRFQAYEQDLSGGLLDRLADDLYHLGGLRRVTITGGEPLLYPFLIPAVFQFTRSFPGTELTVVTNGLRLKSFASFFARAGLHHLTVSLNAGRPESYLEQNPIASATAFAEILDGISAVTAERRLIKSARPRLTLSVVLTRASALDVKPLFEIGRRVGVDAVTFVPLMEILIEGESVNRGLRVDPDLFRRFLAEVDQYRARAKEEGFYLGYAGAADDQGVMDNRDRFRASPCYAGYAFAAVFPNGDVRPCCHCEPIMGNLQESSFVEIWRSPRWQAMRDSMMKIMDQGAELDGCFCRECGYGFENAEFARALKSSP